MKAIISVEQIFVTMSSGTPPSGGSLKYSDGEDVDGSPYL